MIEEASKLSAGLDIQYVTAALDENGLEAGWADVVAALGLIEYLPEDDRLFAEAARLLVGGGRFVVSCRNRLFNLMSANHYTQRELESGAAAALLREVAEELAGTEEADLRELAAATADLVWREDAEPVEPEPREPFEAERRQHTPSELRASADSAGLKHVATLALHPHPLPPALEPLAPRLYNRLALAWQRPLERSGLGLVLCSAFVGVFEKP